MAAAARSAGNAVPGLTIPLFATGVAHTPLWRFAEGLLFHRLRSRPAQLAALKMAGARNALRLPFVQRMIRYARHHMALHLDALDDQLRRHGRDHVCGAEFTLADVSWMPILDRLWEARFDDLFWGGGRRSSVAAYVERLRARPSWQHGIAGHRHPQIVRAREDLAKLWAPLS